MGMLCGLFDFADEGTKMAARRNFGLPLNPFDPDSETADAKASRIAAVKALVLDLFKVTKFHLGEEEAKKLFVDLTRARKGKRAATDTNLKLLAMYDTEVVKGLDKRSAPRRIAERLDLEQKGKFGASAGAIKKRIERLVSTRRKEDLESLRRWEARRSADGKYAGMLGNYAVQMLKHRLK